MFSVKVKTALQAIVDTMPKLPLGQRDVLIANLVFTHHYMVASEELLEQAYKQCSIKFRWEADLRTYFIAHLQEETGHAEWLAKDLGTAGIAPAEAVKGGMYRVAVHMVGTQYYLINHVHPVCLLGYLAVLEGFPMPLEAVAQLEMLHGKELLTTLRYHAEHDVGHSADLDRMLDQVPEALQGEVMNSAIQTIFYIKQFVELLGKGEM